MKKAYLYKQAFTLLELLLVIAIVAVLASIITFALNPAQRLQEANEAKAMSLSYELEKAINMYAIENGGTLPISITSTAQTGEYDICNPTATSTDDCIDLEELVTLGYVNSIPVHPEYSSENTSGYKLAYDLDSLIVNVYQQTEVEEESSPYCPEGDTCDPPVAEWLLNDASGTTAADTSGNSINGTLTNGPVWSAGYQNGGLQFDGTNDYVAITTVPELDIVEDSTKAGTISMWINTTGVSKALIDAKNAGSNTAGYEIRTTAAGNLQMRVANGTSTQTLTSTVAINDGNWKHITAVFDRPNTTLQIYINGQLDNSATLTVTGDFSPHSQIRLGAFNSNVGYLSGEMDNVKIFNYARTVSQIEHEYEN